MDYEKQGKDFLTKTNTTMKVVFLEHGRHFVEDTETRDIFKVTFKRDKKSFSLNFGQSIKESTSYGKNVPSTCDILACLQNYPVGSFEDFCSEFGYDENPLSEYSKVKKIYNGCKKEYTNICKLWNQKEREELQEIN